MLNFNVIYETSIFELPISSESTIMELKLSLLGCLDLELFDFTFFLEKFGNIDDEQMMELPLKELDLDPKTNYLFILNYKNTKNFWKNYCAKKIIGENPTTLAGYKISQNQIVCYPCYLYCHKNKTIDSFIDESETITEIHSTCCCNSIPNSYCKFDSCPDYSSDYSISLPNISSILNHHAKEVINSHKKKEELEAMETLNRNFDFERS